jgi:hypothetical protein
MMSSFAARKARRLSLYEEGSGLFTDLAIEEDGLIAHVGKVNLILPMEIEPTMRQFMGKRITILRTDIPDEQYIIRMLVEDLTN